MLLSDRWLRRVLALPGVVLDWFDADVPAAGSGSPTEVYPLVRASARWPEAHLALEEGLSHYVDEGHVVAWQRRGSTAFAVGGVNAEPEARSGLLLRFGEALAAGGVRRRLLFPVRREELEGAREAGFTAVQVGVEAWMDLPGLDTRGRAWAHVRQMVNRARRRGVTVDEAAPADHAGELGEIYAAWLAARRPKWRMKLLVGSPGLDHPFDRRYFVARSGGRIEAFVTVLPGREGQWGLDVMCRRPDAIPGTMESLVLAVARALQAEGADALSLGPCPMAGVPTRGVGELEGPAPLLRSVFTMLFATKLGNRVFAFQNLYRFKNKFNPRWDPVYFAAQPRLGMVELYLGCRMWGLY